MWLKGRTTFSVESFEMQHERRGLRHWKLRKIAAVGNLIFEITPPGRGLLTADAAHSRCLESAGCKFVSPLSTPPVPPYIR